MKLVFKIKTKPVTQATIVVAVVAFSSGLLALIAIYSQSTLISVFCAIVLVVIAPAGHLYARKKNGGKCQSGTLNHQNGQNDVLITYCTGDWLAVFGFVPACIDNCNLSYHGSAQQLCTQGQNDISVREGCRPC